MNTINKAVSFFCLLIITFSANLTYGQVKEALKEHIIRTMNFREVLDLGSFAITKDDTIYTIDRSTSEIKKFTINGEFISKAGGKGRGPTEFSGPPTRISFNEQSSLLAVNDGKQLGLKLFNRDLTLSHTLPARFPIYDFDFGGDGTIVTSSLPINETIPSVNVYDNNYKLISSFNPSIEKTNFMLDSFYVRSLSRKRILVVFNFRNLIQVYKYNGTLLNSFSLDPLPEMAETKVLETKSPYVKEIPTNFLFQSVDINENEEILVLVGPYSGSEYKDIYTISLQGKVKSIQTLVDKTRYIYLHGDKLYSETNNPIDPSVISIYSR